MQSISAPISASPPCCTPGGRTSIIIPTSIASCQAVASRPLAIAGFGAGQTSSCRCACCRVCSGAVPEGLKALHAADELQFFTDLAGLKDETAFDAYLAPLRKSEWVVYAKRPFAGPAQVLAYLARYTHRVAIGNSRLLDLDDDHVSFRWKDYRENGRQKDQGHAARCRRVHAPVPAARSPRWLPSHPALRLVCQWPPRGQACLCRKLLNVPAVATDCEDGDHDGNVDNEMPPCPCCGGRMKVIETFEGPLSRPYHVRRLDSS